ncbi:Acyl-lipid (8-3)-desaturase [Acropora cervicornis]|uniref:Acyl-lipid (8-3)-desaturase n=1 Tax=Acropora cervicornis TaxID=6130 RepID=A0AAD9Q4V5_ACRCE|nr:Acyl-lipid (8-3)-desaturase [Acropora cervicornis]
MSTNRKFTWEELSSLNQKHNAHVAVRGKVYDVSQFLSRHPGGSEILIMAAGKDVTIPFECYHTFSDIAFKTLDKYYVGDLISNEFPTFPELGILRILHGYGSDTSRCQHSMFLSCVAAVFLGWFSALSSLVNHHDASHFSVTRSPLVWTVNGHLQDFVNGSYYLWMYQHIFGHHPYTNIDGADPDITTAEKYRPELVRIKWSQSWLPRHFYQHIYVPLVYCWVENIRLNEPSTSHLILFISGKLFFVLHKMVIPLIILGFWRMVSWPQPGKDGKMNRDWAELQAETAQDFSTDSWFFNVFSGALNHQTAHHLFPGVSQFYYPQITPIVRQACKEFGVRYNYKDTFTEAFNSHIEHLKTLGQQKEKSAVIKREE